MTPRSLPVLVGGALVALVLAGCGTATADTEEAVATPTPTSTPTPTPEPLTVTSVVDGDTVDLSDGETVRLIGIDAPEDGTCGADEATARLSDLVLGQEITLDNPEMVEDRDKYDRLLAYIVVDGTDAGTVLLSEGLAMPRYNSTDGYGEHPREAEYAEVAAPLITCEPEPVEEEPAAEPVEPEPVQSEPVAEPEPQPVVSYANCDAVRAAGAAPIRAGDPGWDTKFDRDGDGVGCE